jgi:tRNA (guanine-N7-)-methyltransferase
VGSKNKLKRFKENETFANLFQPSREELLADNFKLKGRWHQDYFKNGRPIVLELGCGRGEYSLGLSKRYPDKNFIGIDIKGARIWRGAKMALEEGRQNIAFLRMQIELIEQAFAPGEVSEIWITFPDPQIKYKRTKHRLTNPDFLNRYKNILNKDGLIHLKTDSEFLHGYTIGLLQGLRHDILYAHHDIYINSEVPKEVVGIQTYYENQFLAQGKAITYLKFRLKD